MTTEAPITYADGVTPVMIGDRVRVRLFLFMRRTGRVSYLPGVSPLHGEMEHDWIRNVGIVFDDGGAGGFWLDPATSVLIKTVTFIERDDSPAPELPREEEWR